MVNPFPSPAGLEAVLEEGLEGEGVVNPFPSPAGLEAVLEEGLEMDPVADLVGGHSHRPVEGDLVGFGRHTPDPPVTGDLLRRPITVDLGLLTPLIEAGFGLGFGCHCRFITGLGRRHHQITGTSLMMGTNLITDTSLITGTTLNRLHFSMAGTVDNNFPTLDSTTFE